MLHEMSILSRKVDFLFSIASPPTRRASQEKF